MIPTHATANLHELRNRLRELAHLPDSPAPILSVYLDLRQGAEAALPELERRLGVLDRLLPSGGRPALAQASLAVRSLLLDRAWTGVSGLAVFARGGPVPYFLHLPFSVPFEDWVSADTVPHLYPLMELKDTHDRHFLLLLGRESLRLFEISLGAVSRELLLTAPGLPERAGRIWGRSHYQRSPAGAPDAALRETLAAAERHVRSGRPAKVLLAGDPALVRRARELLPPGLRELEIGALELGQSEPMEEIVRRALLHVVDQEEQESRSLADRLREAVCRNSLGVVGPARTWAALRDGQAEVLVLHEQARFPEAYRCGLCGEFSDAPHCAACGMHPCREVDLRQELVLQAERTGAAVEVVRDHPWLIGQEGVGALLRYGPPPAPAARFPRWQRERPGARAVTVRREAVLA